MTGPPRLRLEEVAFFERDTVFRMPFRYGVVTLRQAPQVFVRARIAVEGGAEGRGTAAELLAPKWFDKSPELSDEDNFDQLRRALAIAAETYRCEKTFCTAFGLHAAASEAYLQACGSAGLPPLAACFGAALIDRAILDGLLRISGLDVFSAVQRNLFGLDGSLTPDLDGFDIGAFLAGRGPAERIRIRHTVGLVDPIEAGDLPEADRVDDGLPETLEEVIRRYGVTFFKLKVGGDIEVDADRLVKIARVLDRLPAYSVTLDGNEQYADVGDVLALWRSMNVEPALARLCRAVLFVEQPISRARALSEDIRPLARLIPVGIDESDASLAAFPAARALGYTGVSSKSCKGFYRSLLNRARCEQWNATTGRNACFMSAEDLSTQAGVAVQQDFALAAIIGCDHVERNGHHYVRGMAAAPQAEQRAFLDTHPDLYERPSDVVQLAVRDGTVSLKSLRVAGLATGVVPDFEAMRACDYQV